MIMWMNKITNQENSYKEPFNLKPLKYYMDGDEREPSLSAIELFFNNTLRKIKNSVEDPEEIERNREKWKDIFEELIELPINNSIYTCYKKLREEGKNSQFQILIETVRDVIISKRKTKINPNSIRDIKQSPLETVESFNKRFYQALKESEIEMNKNLIGMLTTNEPMPKGLEKYMRTELFYIYKQSLQEKIRTKFPLIQPRDMCLENAMNQAMNIEMENIRLQDCNQRSNFKPRHYVHQINIKDN
uniref:CCHC-type domain-containing protein n=1 Tax=Strongyloides stercoralis TaxID=6248 RepID=A0A0K0EA89_STRER